MKKKLIKLQITSSSLSNDKMTLDKMAWGIENACQITRLQAVQCAIIVMNCGKYDMYQTTNVRDVEYIHAVKDNLAEFDIKSDLVQ